MQRHLGGGKCKEGDRKTARGWGWGGQSRSGREAEPKVPEQLSSQWAGGKKEQDTCRLKITVLGRITVGF